MSWFLLANDIARATPWLHTPARLFAEFGIVGFAILLLLSWWSARRTPGPRAMAAALWAPAGVLIAIGLNQPLVNLVAEPRPFTVFPHALVLVSRSTDFSFPSDHAVMAGAVAAGVILSQGLRCRLAALAVTAAIAMAFTRVYVGAHFPRDVLVGLLFGALVAVGSYLAGRPVLERIVVRLHSTRLRPLLTGSPDSSVERVAA